MKNTHRTSLKLTLAALLGTGLSLGLAGCGDDDSSSSGGYNLDCSKCTGDFAEIAQNCDAYGKACKDEGETASACQETLDVLCGGDPPAQGG